NRAVIVGSPTFGKATAQRYLPADSTLERFDIDFGNFQSDVKDKVKITIAKLYRVNGLNNQLRGVQPDILLPDVFDSLGYREQYMSHYLSLDTLKRKGVYEPFRPLPIAALRQKSEQRIAQTPGFKLVAEGNKLYTERKKLIEKPLSLQYSAFTDLSKKYIARGRKVLKDIREDSTHIYSTTNYYRVAPDPNKKPDEWEVEINNKVLENITRDIYVHEAFAIVKDMIDLKKK
ncbi:MAG TPA: carboxy terminal-processing peptidase, partial [Chitinophagales bacterium]|nr:carboxy terminal-processing peptidase [Chitinophagales bacterium]